MRTLLLLAALVGCGGETAHGIRTTGFHGDRAALQATLSRCARDLPPGSLDGARVWFVPSAEAWCVTGYREIAGCYRADIDVAFAESLAVLPHELRHRAQWVTDGVLDLNHSDARWWGDD